MDKKSKLKICILGGRSFGKTALLSSLLLISGDKDSGITLSGGKQKNDVNQLNIYNKYKKEKGTLIATSWKDICHFIFKITSTNKKQWQVTFPDYPGELFQTFIDKYSMAFINWLKNFFVHEQTQQKVDACVLAPDDVKKAQKLIREIEYSDALIILLPADVTETAYQNNLDVFKTCIQLLLEKVLECNPHIPVCLAINKWDMFDKNMDDLDSVLAEEPYREFSNMLERECPEHYFPQAVSAYGGHEKSDKQKWNKDSQPQNVLEMLIKLADEAEAARYQLLRERYKKANIFSKIIMYPFVFWKIYRKGANQAEDRKFCQNELLKTSSMLLASICSIVAVAILTLSTIISVQDYNYIAKQYKEANRILSKFMSSEEPGYNIDKERIQQFKDDIAGYPRKLALFCGKKEEATRGLICKIEDEYNRRVFKLCSEYCAFEENKDQSPSMMVSSVRLSRCDKRKKRLEEAREQLTKFPTKNDEGRELADVLDESIVNEERLRDNIKDDSPLDDKLYQLAQLKKEDLCQEIEKTLDDFEGYYTHRKESFDFLRKQLETIEEEYEKALKIALEQIKDIPDSIDCEERIRLANSRIEKIQAEDKHFSTRSKYLEMHRKLISSDTKLIDDCRHDIPFFDALKQLQDIPENEKIRKIDTFLHEYNSLDYPRCAKYINEFKEERNRLIQQLKEKIEIVLNNNQITPKMPAKEKIVRLTAQKNIYEVAVKKYSVGSEEYINAIKKLEEIAVQLSMEDKNEVFEAAFNKLMTSSDEGKLRKIEIFKAVDRFTIESYPNKKASFEILKEEEKRLIAKWNDYRTTVEKDNSDNPELPATERSQKINKLIKAYEKLRIEYCESSNEYKQIVNLLEKAKELQGSLAVYIEFDKDWQKILHLDDHSKPQALDEHLIKYSDLNITENRYLKLLKTAREMYNKYLAEFKDEMNKDIEKILKEAEGTTWQNQSAACLKIIEIINKYKDLFPTKESRFFDILIEDNNKNRAELEHYGKLTDAFNEIPQEASPIIILNSIVYFSNNFKQQDYPKNTKVFRDIDELCKNMELSLKSSINSTIETIVKPEQEDFAKSIVYYTKCKKIIEDILHKLDERTGIIYDDIRKIHEDFSIKLELNARFDTISNIVKPIIKDDGQSDVQVSELRLSAIKAFKEQYPRSKNPEIELKTLYDKVDEIQKGVEENLAKYINKQLEEINSELPPEATNDLIILNLKKRLDFLKKYTAIMLQDSNIYMIYNSKVNEMQDSFDDKVLDDVFRKESETLQDNLNSSIAVREKIQLINNFVGRFTKYERYAATIREFTNRLEQFNNEATLEEIVSEINHLIKNRPAEDAQIFVLSEYKNKISNYVEKIKKYIQITYLQIVANDELKKLNEQIQYVEKAIGDGSYNDILKKERAYKANSSSAELQSLRNAISSFDKGKYPQFIERVTDIENNLDKDRRLFSKVEEAISSFSNKPSKTTFDYLDDAITQFSLWSNSYGSTHTVIDDYRKYINSVKNGMQVSLVLDGACLLKSNHIDNSAWDDLMYYISVRGDKRKYECTLNEKDKIKEISKPGLVSLPYGTTINIEIIFDNYINYKPIYTNLSYWDIVKLGMHTGRFKHRFEGINEKNQKGYLDFEINGVPILK